MCRVRSCASARNEKRGSQTKRGILTDGTACQLHRALIPLNSTDSYNYPLTLDNSTLRQLHVFDFRTSHVSHATVAALQPLASGVRCAVIRRYHRHADYRCPQSGRLIPQLARGWPSSAGIPNRGLVQERCSPNRARACIARQRPRRHMLSKAKSCAKSRARKEPTPGK